MKKMVIKRCITIKPENREQWCENCSRGYPHGSKHYSKGGPCLGLENAQAVPDQQQTIAERKRKRKVAIRDQSDGEDDPPSQTAKRTKGRRQNRTEGKESSEANLISGFFRPKNTDASLATVFAFLDTHGKSEETNKVRAELNRVNAELTRLHKIEQKMISIKALCNEQLISLKASAPISSKST